MMCPVCYGPNDSATSPFEVCSTCASKIEGLHIDFGEWDKIMGYTLGDSDDEDADEVLDEYDEAEEPTFREILQKLGCEVRQAVKRALRLSRARLFVQNRDGEPERPEWVTQEAWVNANLAFDREMKALRGQVERLMNERPIALIAHEHGRMRSTLAQFVEPNHEAEQPFDTLTRLLTELNRYRSGGEPPRSVTP